ncbi:sortase-sorted surface protein [Opitutaceae bacterium TAV5]|nr:sortase-sorted surface protein [Opitutaceae bacterium TAV5]
MNYIHQLLRISALAALTPVLLTATSARAQILGSAGNYGALGGSTVTNTGGTVITGGLGVSPGSAITGFAAVDGGPGLFTGTLDQGNATAAQAQADAAAAYVTLANLSFTTDLSGQDLGGMVLLPGVYYFDSAAQLTGLLTLDAQGDANARFVFQIGSTLTTASSSQVSIININTTEAGGPDSGLFWQVGSSATLGTDSQFAGNILALTSITLDAGASIDHGRALAQNGAVTLDNNRIDASDLDGGFGVIVTPIPEASTFGLAGAGMLLLIVWQRRHVACRRSSGM